MQEQQAAGFSKEAKRAAEERAALEAFRAAALQVYFANAVSPWLTAVRAG